MVKSKYIQSLMDQKVLDLLKDYGIKVSISRETQGAYAPWDNSPHNKYRVTLENKFGRRKTWTFYDSYMNFIENKYPSVSDVIDAIFSEATLLDSNGIYDLDDYIRVFHPIAYDDPEEMRKAKREFRALERAMDKLMDLGLTEEEIFEILNKIKDWENENLYDKPPVTKKTKGKPSKKGPVHVKSHTRKLKSGKLVKVREHTRSKPKKRR